MRGGYHLNGDHWPIDAFLRLERKELWARSIKMSSRSEDGHPKNDDAKQIFMRRVATDLCWMKW